MSWASADHSGPRAALQQRRLLRVPVIGVDLADLTTAALRALVRQAITASGEQANDKALHALMARMTYEGGDIGDPATADRLADTLGTSRHPLYYLAAGVPCFIRAGKALACRDTEIRVFFLRPPRLAFVPSPLRPEPNQIILRVDPDPGLRTVLQAKAPQSGSCQPVHLDLRFVEELGPPPEPYERLLDAALRGDHRLFARRDCVEETWGIVQPLLDAPPAVQLYPVGSFGPTAADAVVRGFPRWRYPWLPTGGPCIADHARRAAS